MTTLEVLLLSLLGLAVMCLIVLALMGWIWWKEAQREAPHISHYTPEDAARMQ